MAKPRDEQPRKRFSKSGHTSHQPRVAPGTAPPGYLPPPPVHYDPPPYQPPPPPPPHYDDGYGVPTYHRPPPHQPPDGYHSPPTTQPYETAPESSTVGRAALSLGKATLSGTNKAARTVTRKVITASKSDGAEESGLTALIWNQVLSYGTDAMITVALAGTVFFGASAHAQRGNVLLYLLITMAPFAVVAPIIGPALDRLQHGRRWTMAGTAAGRAILALIMAGHPTELLVLYPCALGSLVLSKAYGVVRAAAAPRLVPPGMTLTAANAKLTIFGLGSTIVLGGFVGVVIKLTGSYTAGLVVTAFGFAACAFFAFKLPSQVDSAVAAARHPQEPMRPRRQEKVPPLSRIHSWARKGFDPHLVIALQGESVLRLLSGLLTIYLAFYVESTSHGLSAALGLGAVIGAAGAGNFVGTAIGTRLAMAKPEQIIVISVCVAAVACIVGALTFSVLVAVIVMFVCAVTNALSKIALDALIQNDVVETLRSSAFARSETFLQLAWVVGAALGVALPSKGTGDGALAFVVAGVVCAGVAVVVVLRSRAMLRHRAVEQWPDHPGSVVRPPR
ncbi:MAG TPA: MFS transporter [Jatrophihabitans sp.]|uniref:MFS transporter n=1 Tax=Jatrophihabitans sp. TaxID=1932789 RepID=UPI002E057530|nr:MFS transporter [Jatrophihabitans sp.]